MSLSSQRGWVGLHPILDLALLPAPDFCRPGPEVGPCSQTEIDSVLQQPRQGAGREELRQHLQLLVETFKRARSLAEDLQVLGLAPSVVG